MPGPAINLSLLLCSKLDILVLFGLTVCQAHGLAFSNRMIFQSRIEPLFILNMLALSVFTLKCSLSSIFGGQIIFSHINYFLNQRVNCAPEIQFWKKNVYSEEPNLSLETHFLDSSSWTHPVQSPVHSESSVVTCHYGNMINILAFCSSCHSVN